MCRSSPSRRNTGCGATRTVTYRSPAGPPRMPGIALRRRRAPGRRRRHPAGIRTVTRLGARLLTAARARLARPRALLTGAAARACSCARTPCARAPIAPRRCPGRRDRTRTSIRVTPGARARAAGLAPRDRDRTLGCRRTPPRTTAASRWCRSAPRSAARAPRAALGEHLGEQIAERRRVVRAARREVEALEPAALTSRRRSTSMPGVVARPPRRIDQASRRPRGSAGSAPPPSGHPD